MTTVLPCTVVDEPCRLRYTQGSWARRCELLATRDGTAELVALVMLQSAVDPLWAPDHGQHPSQ